MGGDWMMKSHLKLDALTYTMFLSPMCLIVLMVGAAVTWKAEILMDFAAWWMFIIPNGCLAFTMNVTVSLLIKECSAFAFILAGLVKDAVVVSVERVSLAKPSWLSSTWDFSFVCQVSSSGPTR